MENHYLQKIVEALATEEDQLSDTTFCTETQISPMDIEVVVNEIGKLLFQSILPLSIAY